MKDKIEQRKKYDDIAERCEEYLGEIVDGDVKLIYSHDEKYYYPIFCFEFDDDMSEVEFEEHFDNLKKIYKCVDVDALSDALDAIDMLKKILNDE